MGNSRRGRPVGASDVRERLITAARQRFTTHGYDATSIRAIARDAGVDHSMVKYHFGSKQRLFGAVVTLTLTPRDVLDAIFDVDAPLPADELATRLVATIVTAWDRGNFSAAGLTILRPALAHESARNLVAEYLSSEIVARVAAHIGGPDAGQRASGVATVIAGTITTRYLLRLEPIASMPAQDVVRTLAPMVALQLAGRVRHAGGPGHRPAAAG